MPQLLVSCRDAAEAAAALQGGCHIVDVKEPTRGPLGPADPDRVNEVLQVCAGRQPVSVAMGDVPDPWLPPPGPAFAKLGLAQATGLDSWYAAWHRVATALPDGCGLVAVVYADWQRAQAPSPDQILRSARKLGCCGLLVDTFDKSGGGVFDHLANETLQEWFHTAQAYGWFTALAGSLTAEQLPRAARLGVDLVAVRGAACVNGRQGSVDGTRVRQLRQCLEDCNPGAPRQPLIAQKTP